MKYETYEQFCEEKKLWHKPFNDTVEAYVQYRINLKKTESQQTETEYNPDDFELVEVEKNTNDLCLGCAFDNGENCLVSSNEKFRCDLNNAFMIYKRKGAK